MRLTDMRKGQSGVVVRVGVEGTLDTKPNLPLETLRRLIELGFIAGERVRVLAEAFPLRDPIAVRIGDTSFALRRLEASAVWVTPDFA